MGESMPLDYYAETINMLRAALPGDTATINWLFSSQWGDKGESLLYRMAVYNFHTQLAMLWRMYA